MTHDPAQTILICANAYQAGWLQTHDARTALESHGARPYGSAGSGLWTFPNGDIVRFVSVYSNVQEVLRHAARSTMVVLLYESGHVDRDLQWRITSQLSVLKRQQGFRVVHFDELDRHYQERWSVHALQAPSPQHDSSIPIDQRQTVPLDHLLSLDTLRW
jgi:hypothetical protein